MLVYFPIGSYFYILCLAIHEWDEWDWKLSKHKAKMYCTTNCASEHILTALRIPEHSTELQTLRHTEDLTLFPPPPEGIH